MIVPMQCKWYVRNQMSDAANIFMNVVCYLHALDDYRIKGARLKRWKGKRRKQPQGRSKKTSSARCVL